MKSLPLILLTALLYSSASGASMTPEAARQVVAKVDPAVISVKVVIKTTMSMEGRESGKEDNQVEATGCVVDKSGLTAVSLTVVDPSAMYDDMMKSMGDAPDSSKFKYQSEISDLKLVFADGKEIAGEVAIRDKDLDLAFIRPKQPLAAPVAAIDLSTAVDALLLDQVLVVSRLGKMGNFTTVARVVDINAILAKPRKMYLMMNASTEMDKEMGAAAFSTDGKPIGIIVLRKAAGGGSDRPEIFPAILPAKDVLQVARQVTANQ